MGDGSGAGREEEGEGVVRAVALPFQGRNVRPVIDDRRTGEVGEVDDVGMGEDEGFVDVPHLDGLGSLLPHQGDGHFDFAGKNSGKHGKNG